MSSMKVMGNVNVNTKIGRARKSMVSWYPGYQPMSNLAANFGWAKGTDSHNLRINSQQAGAELCQAQTSLC